MITEKGQAAKEAFRRYVIDGTSDSKSGYGPPYRGPWFLIDTSKAEPEVNWPGELVAQYQNHADAADHLWNLVAEAVNAVEGE